VKLNDISVESQKKHKNFDEYEFYPSAEVACKRDNIKSISTTTTANRIDNNKSDKYSKIIELIPNSSLANSNNEKQKDNSNDKENKD
jgi:hypothetical protein